MADSSSQENSQAGKPVPQPNRDASPISRYLPDVPFPAYAFVPGQHPHPVTDSQGHSFGLPHESPLPLDVNAPASSRDFLFAIDLFNAGYYWEAHEVWEGLWVAAGRTGTHADFLKALIKLAAAGVKARVGQIVGVQRHAVRAVELLQFVKANRMAVAVGDRSTQTPFYAGLMIDELIQDAQRLADKPTVDQAVSVEGRAVLPIRLKLRC